jgi:Uma2 family endonuclease
MAYGGGMSHALTDQPPPVTVAAFDRFLDTQRGEMRHELIGGEIVAMTNPTIAHEVIVGNIGRPLGTLMRGRNCHVSQGGIHVQSREDGQGTNKPRPDLIAFCGPVDMRRNYVSNPLVVVEVLSPGNMDFDRGAKLRFYKTALPMLQHIALVYQDQVRVEHFRRTDAGWATEVLMTSDAVLRFDAVGFEIEAGEIYAGTDIEGSKP